MAAQNGCKEGQWGLPLTFDKFTMKQEIILPATADNMLKL